MRSLASAVAVAMLVCVACTHPPQGSVAIDESIECSCGEKKTELLGCYNPACISGIGNPDNPDCACAGLHPKSSQTHVALGGTEHEGIGQMQYLTLRSGKNLRGVLLVDDLVAVRIKKSNGEVVDIPYTNLHPRSVYRLMKARTPDDDGPGLIEVANYARDNGLYAHAGRTYAKAVAADKSLAEHVDQELLKLREMASQDLLASAGEARASGKLRDAEDLLGELLREFPDEPAADEASALMRAVTEQLDDERRSKEPSLAEVVDKELKPARKHYDKAVEENREGLMVSSKPSKAIKRFESSLKSGDRARREIDKVKGKRSVQPGVVNAADELDVRVVVQLVDTNLNLASVYMVRESFNDALGSANRAIALDPKSTDARSMRARIEQAATDDDWDGWLLRRPRR